MSVMIVQELQPLHHPRVQAIARMFRDLARNVKPIAQPRKLAARRRREDRNLAILALVSMLHPAVDSAGKSEGPRLREGPLFFYASAFVRT
jgi:hypothetical protein